MSALDGYGILFDNKAADAGTLTVTPASLTLTGTQVYNATDEGAGGLVHPGDDAPSLGHVRGAWATVGHGHARLGQRRA